MILQLKLAKMPVKMTTLKKMLAILHGIISNIKSNLCPHPMKRIALKTIEKKITKLQSWYAECIIDLHLKLEETFNSKKSTIYGN